MFILDDLQKIQKIDQQNYWAHIAGTAEHIKAALKNTIQEKLPKSYRNFSNIVFVGMGGSAIGASLAESLLGNQLKVPFMVIRNYTLPAFVSNKTLVIACSFSGNTEEVLQAAATAIAKKTKLIVITNGGKLELFAFKNKLPLINLGASPTIPPRTTATLVLATLFALLAKLKLIPYQNTALQATIPNVDSFVAALSPTIKTKNNLAKSTATAIGAKVPFILAADFLAPIARRFKCQVNENAKRPATFDTVPEASHNTFESLNGAANNGFFYLLLSSNLYHKRNQLRTKLFAAKLKKERIPYLEFKLEGQNTIEQLLEALVFVDCLSYYLALLGGTNPTIIPNITKLKKSL